jgi:hypothetical protein
MKHPPYHLRPNKAVDRLLLVELLRAVGAVEPPLSEFTYYGFGGPFLEDMRPLDEYVPDIQLVSVESNQQTRKRQERHRFSSRVRLFPKQVKEPGTMNEFLSRNYAPGERDIFWLDYTDLSWARIQEFQRVVGLVPVNSIVRITLRAEITPAPAAVKDFLPEDQYKAMRQAIKEDFEATFGNVLPQHAEDDIFDHVRFPAIILSMLREATEETMRDYNDRELLPVHTLVYDDNTQMLTFTGMVIGRGTAKNVMKRYANTKFATFSWEHIHRINLPVLSLRETILLAPFLPESKDAGADLWEQLGYDVASGRRRSEEALAHYGEFHRYHPQFARLFV